MMCKANKILNKYLIEQSEDYSGEFPDSWPVEALACIDELAKSLTDFEMEMNKIRKTLEDCEVDRNAMNYLLE